MSNSSNLSNDAPMIENGISLTALKVIENTLKKTFEINNETIPINCWAEIKRSVFTIQKTNSVEIQDPASLEAPFKKSENLGVYLLNKEHFDNYGIKDNTHVILVKFYVVYETEEQNNNNDDSYPRVLCRKYEIVVSSDEKIWEVIKSYIPEKNITESEFEEKYILETGDDKYISSNNKFSIIKDCFGVIIATARLYSMADDPNSIPIGESLRGIKNIGNTCFMNSSLQCIYRCYSLTKKIFEMKNFFYEKEHSKEIAVFKEYENFLKELSIAKENQIVVPDELLAKISSIYSEYGEGCQQDSMEFIIRLLDILHTVCNTIDPEEKEESWWDSNKSIIVDLFFFKLCSTIKCLNCGCERVNFEPSMCLPLPIPPENKKDFKIYFFSPEGPPVRLALHYNETVADMKKYIEKKYGIMGDLIFVTFSNDSSPVVLKDSTVLYEKNESIYCFEYEKNRAENYYWIKINTIGGLFFMKKSWPFYILADFNEKINLSSTVEEHKIKISEVLKSNLLKISGATSTISSETLNFYKLETTERCEILDTLTEFPVITATLKKSEIEKIGASNDVIKDITANENTDITLEMCLDQFIKEENLDRSITLDCPKCQRETNFSKRTNIATTPKYLIIHLKRFMYYRSAKKNRTPIKFNTDAIFVCNSWYRVIGTINHYEISGINSGHYVSYIYHDGTWYLCNDEYITKKGEVDLDYVYVIFLEKVVDDKNL